MTTDIRDQRRIDPSGSHTGQRGIRLRRLRGWCFASAIFIAVSALAGALTAGLGSQWFPRSLDIAKPPARSQVLMADGQVLASFFTENRVPVRLADIAPVMRQAIMAVEDHRFFQHGAVDLRGMIRALVHNATGQPGVQGGSSITQQYVKMSLVERCRGDEQCVKNATAATLARKVRELRYAVALEKQLTKDQILEGYLNTAYFGEGAYGVEAAAEHYFSTAAADLSLPQAAMLAGLVRAPDATNPVSHLNEAIKRRDFVISMMAQLQMISAHQADTARAASYSPHPTVVRSGCVGSPYPFICDFVRRTLLRQPSLGRTAAERTTMLNEGGLTIQTTIDPHVQDLAQARISDVVGPTDPLISTMNMIEPNTGRIIAMAQSRPVMGDDAAKGQTYWNLSADPSLGGAQGYQAGSTFKAFTAAAALEQGIPLSTQLDARHTIDYQERSFDTCSGRDHVHGKWKVTNSTRANGVMDMYRAAAYSVNNYFVQLEFETGMCPVTQMAQRLGVELGTPGRNLVDYYQHVPAFTLGSVEVSPLSMAEAYATFAARGMHCHPIIIDSITRPNGQKMSSPAANCQQVMTQSVADGINKLLSYVMTNGTGRRAMTSDGRPQAGKTGTISSNEAVWFAGYTPRIAGLAMISIDNQRAPFMRSANPDPRVELSGVKGYTVPSTGITLAGTGSSDAGQKIWKPIMDGYLAGTAASPFVEPSTEVTGGPPRQGQN